MKIILGIGNPGARYAKTRHNVGFMVADRFAEKHGFGAWRRRFHSNAAEGSCGGTRVLLLKPETYVNESGRALRSASDWCTADARDMMVVCDDFNLPCGRLRVRPKGAGGGHRGLESIGAHMAAQDVPRLRIGIGAADMPRGEDKEFVLSAFRTDERALITDAVERAVCALEVWIEFGMERCQNEFNVDPKTAGDRNQKEADA